jgi:hypothetical protein
MFSVIRTWPVTPESHRKFCDDWYLRDFADLTLKCSENVRLNKDFLILGNNEIHPESDRRMPVKHLVIVGQITNLEIELAAANPADNWGNEINPSIMEWEMDSLRSNAIQLFGYLAKKEFENLKLRLLSELEIEFRCWEEFEIRLRFMTSLMELEEDEKLLRVAVKMIWMVVETDNKAIIMAWKCLLAEVIQYLNLSLLRIELIVVSEISIPNSVVISLTSSDADKEGF